MVTRSYPDSEGLQVSPEREGLIVNPNNPGLEVYTKAAEPVPYFKEDTVVDERSVGRDGRICGLARRTFWIVLVVVAIVIVAAAVGGGVGGSMAAKDSNKSENNQSSPTPTSTSTPTSSTTPTSSSTSTSSITPAGPFPTSGVLPLDCPAINGTTYSTIPSGSSSNYTYLINCDVNYEGPDVFKTRTRTLDLCMDECAKHSDANSNNPCALVVWIGNLTLALPNTDGNCYLKGNVVAPNAAKPSDNYAGAVWIGS
ncbi:hypothetical protein V496_04957 [Pseudogymnoascus sp. VKM F-4515 (FW-2607)]|nr:hypothetical protein V496_04957 [Pseudogymnoascus sp. VKM F-4515 (FW-2607)]KFY94156.1 hypothetical protein V498_04023 [Pseudogymnoascus sp. VKM F-4517 (FW-2822)]